MKLVALLALTLALLSVAFAFGRATVTESASATPTDAQLNVLRDINRNLGAIHRDLGSQGTISRQLTRDLGSDGPISRQLTQVCRTLSHIDTGLSVGC
jgi:hypothetical protein